MISFMSPANASSRKAVKTTTRRYTHTGVRDFVIFETSGIEEV
jgi:hypothetical protein